MGTIKASILKWWWSKKSVAFQDLLYHIEKSASRKMIFVTLVHAGAMDLNKIICSSAFFARMVQMHVSGLNKCPELSASEGSKGRNVRAFFGRYDEDMLVFFSPYAAPCKKLGSSRIVSTIATFLLVHPDTSYLSAKRVIFVLIAGF